MDVILPCTSFRSVNLKPESSRSFLSTNRNRRFSDLLKCRRKTTSTELHATVDVAGRTDDGSASIPTHKVTVHDRERGVVHEFVVPEVRHNFQFALVEMARTIFNFRFLSNFFSFVESIKCFSPVFLDYKLFRVWGFEVFFSLHF